MTKLSGLNTNAAPALGDFVAGVLAGLSADDKITITSLLQLLVGGTTLSSLVQSYANPGTAGGTMYYINLGGIKLLWGTTASLSYSGASAQFSITFPASFFTTLQGYGIGQGNAGGTYGQKIEYQTNYPTATAANLQVNNSGAGASNITCGYWMVGT